MRKGMMIWIVLFLLVAGLALFLVYQLFRLVVFVGSALVAGAYVAVMGMLSLGFLTGLGSLLILYNTSGSFPLAITVGIFIGIAVPLFVGKMAIAKVKGAIRRIRREKPESKGKINSITI
jgi:hypothetical protein